ncbi:hypothetical protein DFO83_102149 [Idiomarina loihiensis]|uniref:hypothetical protein n=1 Tax=Idiomarina TaxID=135575 RepID=UPI000D711A87|nr:hypothetical protein [Idiomarina]PWW40331.1 hypothetical protein DFO83_102149 [Idiomarina loihiensis]TDP50022.1 hypothetical protein DET58_102145 [Idiomarina loihiensis]TDS24626.1 hypothetical protein DET62_102235 [Idiomarina sp. H2]
MNRNNKKLSLIAILFGLRIFTAQASGEVLSTETTSTLTSTEQFQITELSAEEQAAVEWYQMVKDFGICTPYPQCKIKYIRSS